MTHRDLYLVCYDISCPRRWRRVHRLLSAYRMAGQKSVFECLMTGGELESCVRQLRRFIEPTEDRVHVLALDPRMSREGWGRGAPYDGGPLVVA